MSTSVGTLIENDEFVTLPPEAPVIQAVHGLAKYPCQALVVVDNERVVGTLSEREILSKVIFNNLDLATTPVGKVMTPATQVVKKSSSAEECLEIMKAAKLRTIPVVGWFGKPTGLISIAQVLMSVVELLREEKRSHDAQEAQGKTFQFDPMKDRLRLLVSQQTVLELSSTETAMEAVQIFCSFNIGCALVTENGKLVGIISERDVNTRVLAKNAKPHKTPIREVMTSEVKTVGIEASADTCLSTMNQIGSRHIPVMDGEKIAGVVSITDCLKWIYEDIQEYNLKRQKWMEALIATGE